MLFSKSFPAVLAILASGSLASPITLPEQSKLVRLTLQQQLELASTAVDRLALIPNDQDFVFDFNASTEGITEGKGNITFFLQKSIADPGC